MAISRVFLATTLMMLLATTSMATAASNDEGRLARRLQASCAGGCASWKPCNNCVKRTCAACCNGWMLNGGTCVKQTTAAARGPNNNVAGGYQKTSVGRRG